MKCWISSLRERDWSSSGSGVEKEALVRGKRSVGAKGNDAASLKQYVRK